MTLTYKRHDRLKSSYFSHLIVRLLPGARSRGLSGCSLLSRNLQLHCALFAIQVVRGRRSRGGWGRRGGWSHGSGGGGGGGLRLWCFGGGTFSIFCLLCVSRGGHICYFWKERKYIWYWKQDMHFSMENRICFCTVLKTGVACWITLCVTLKTGFVLCAITKTGFATCCTLNRIYTHNRMHTQCCAENRIHPLTNKKQLWSIDWFCKFNSIMLSKP